MKKRETVGQLGGGGGYVTLLMAIMVSFSLYCLIKVNLDSITYISRLIACQSVTLKEERN